MEEHIRKIRKDVQRGKRLKVCIVITGLGVGGAENHLLKTISLMDIDPFIISLTDNDEVGKEIEKAGTKIYYLGYKNILSIFSVIRKFRKIIRKEKPDIINSYLIHANLFSRLFGRLFGVKKVVCSVRNKHIDKPFLMFLDRISSSLVDVYLPNSQAIADFMISKGFRKDKIEVIPNGIVPEDYNIKVDKEAKRKELGVEEKDFVVAVVGSLLPKKDHATLIKALALSRRNDMKLLFIGEGPLRKDLGRLAREKEVSDCISFLGIRKDVKEILKVTDLFVLPSKHEGMSNALLEAIASGCKVLVSNIEENKELLRGNLEKMTFIVGDAEDLAEKLDKGDFERSALSKKLITSNVARLYSETLKKVK